MIFLYKPRIFSSAEAPDIALLVVPRPQWPPAAWWRQAVVVKAFDDGSKVRSFGHCLVAGIDRAPLKVTRRGAADGDVGPCFLAPENIVMRP